MPDLTYPVIIWIVFLGLAVPFVMWAKHPETRPIAAYLIFVSIFSVAAWIVYTLAVTMIARFAGSESLAGPVAPIAIFLTSVVIAAALGTWQIAKPPRPAPPI